MKVESTAECPIAENQFLVFLRVAVLDMLYCIMKIIYRCLYFYQNIA